MAKVEIKQLNRGDTIRCPVDGSEERVVIIKHHIARLWLIRTSRHDHLRRFDDQVEKVK